MVTFTMVARIGRDIKEPASGFMLISNSYDTAMFTSEQLRKAIAEKSCEVINLDSELKATNGALNKYTMLDESTGAIIGKAYNVILNRVEKDGKLVGYTMFTTAGKVVNVNVETAVSLARQQMISNGKIRETQTGAIVSSINGNYPLREIKVEDAPKSAIHGLVMYMAVMNKQNKGLTYAGVLFQGTSVPQMQKFNSEVKVKNQAFISRVHDEIGLQDVKELEAVNRNMTMQFAVISLSTLKGLIRDNPNLELKTNSTLLLSAVDYTDGEPIESRINVTKGWVKKVSESGTKVGDRNVETLYNEVVKSFKDSIQFPN